MIAKEGKLILDFGNKNGLREKTKTEGKEKGGEKTPFWPLPKSWGGHGCASGTRKRERSGGTSETKNR